jgi:hypothetical protein
LKRSIGPPRAFSHCMIGVAGTGPTASPDKIGAAAATSPAAAASPATV